MAKKIILFRGNVPEHGEFIAQVEDWCVYKMPSTTDVWLNMKLVSLAPRQRKANFWLGFDLKKRNLARTNDGRVFMSKEYDVLRAWLLGVLESKYPAAPL